MRRKFGYDMATIFEYAEAKTTFSKHTAADALNRTFWRYPKHLYKFYVSSENHQVRKSFPLKYWLFALVPLILFFIGFSQSKQTGFFGLFGKDKQQVEQVNTITRDQTTKPTKNESDKLVICNYDNIHTPECQALQQITNGSWRHTPFRKH